MLTGCSPTSEPVASAVSAEPSTPAPTSTASVESSSTAIPSHVSDPASVESPVATAPSAPPVAPAPAAPAPAAPAPGASTTDAASLQLSVESLEIIAEDGTALHSFSYFTPLDDSVIAKLSAGIGAEPTITKYGDDAENPDYATYQWDGALLTGGNHPADTEYANWSFTVSAASVGALDTATKVGLTVGSTRSDAEAAGAILDESGSTPVYSLGAVEIGRNGNAFEFCLYLGVSGDTITEIGGPAHTNRL
jgi:hypothetical protein